MRFFPKWARWPATFTLLAFFIPTAAGASGYPSALPAAPPTVEGKVTSADGNPISGARVTLHSGNAAVTGISDAHGAFKVTVARRGVFTVTAGAAGYSSLKGEWLKSPMGPTR